MKARPLKTGYRRLYVDLLAAVIYASWRTPEDFKKWLGVEVKMKLVDEAGRR